jgi:hypothetical protein
VKPVRLFTESVSSRAQYGPHPPAHHLVMTDLLVREVLPRVNRTPSPLAAAIQAVRWVCRLSAC